MSGDYERVIADLQRNGSVTDPTVTVERVGRNRVWRVEPEDPRQEDYYVKIADEEAWFRREVLGLEIARYLANRHEWIMAPEVHYTDAKIRAIVLGPIRGVSGTEMIRDAFRLDRNPLHRQEPIQRFGHALRAMVKWIGALHESPLPDRLDPLVDHRFPSVRGRVLDKLRRALRATSLDASTERLLAVEHLPSPEGSDAGRLICGDATLGNFYWDGQRVGRIDFEDLGVGTVGRDFNTMRLWIKRVTEIPWYRSRDVPVTEIPGVDENPENTLHTLEWKLDYLWSAHQNGARKRMRKLVGEIQDLLDELTGESVGNSSFRS